MSAITAKARRKMKKYAVLTREPRCFLGSFDFSWEQRKLGDVVKEITRNDPESEAPIMMITANNGFIEQSERYAFNNAGESLKKYILLKKGELAYNHGASKLRPYGSCFALTTAENARIPFVYHCFSAENQNAEFMSIELNGAEIENQLRKIVSSGARMDGLLNISFDEYTSVSVLLPGTEEQDRIADFFRHLDNLITLHQRKCVFLFSFFRACISMNFTASTFSWEQRKLSELTSMHARIGWQNLRTSEFLDSGDYMLITGTDFNDGAINFSTCHYVERERYEQDRNIQIHNGSILITKDGTLGKVAYVQGLSMPATLNAGVFNVQIKDANNVDERYLFQYLKAPFLMDYVDKKATGGTIKHLNQSILVDFPVILPQRSEQILIGAFFQQLDNLITLHQRKPFLMKWRTSDANRNQTNRLVL